MVSKQIIKTAETNGFKYEHTYRTPYGWYLEFLSYATVDILLVFVSRRHECTETKVIELHPAEQNVDNHNIIDKTHRPIDISGVYERDQLELSYNKAIVMDTDSIDLDGMYKQLTRLSYCVKNLHYRISVFNGDYVGFVDRNNKVMILQSKTTLNRHRLAIVVPYQMFLDKIDIVSKDCSKIVSSVYDILNTNHSKNIESFNKLLERKQDSIHTSMSIHTQKEEYLKYIYKYQQLLQTTRENELLKQQDIHTLDKIFNTEKLNLAQDMKMVHRKEKLEKELEKIRQTKRSIIETLQELKHSADKLFLDSDTIVFDNIILLDKIWNNFEKLSQYSP